MSASAAGRPGVARPGGSGPLLPVGRAVSQGPDRPGRRTSRFACGVGAARPAALTLSESRPPRGRVRLSVAAAAGPVEDFGPGRRPRPGRGGKSRCRSGGAGWWPSRARRRRRAVGAVCWTSRAAGLDEVEDGRAQRAGPVGWPATWGGSRVLLGRAQPRHGPFQLCDRVTVMVTGSVLYTGTPSERAHNHPDVLEAYLYRHPPLSTPEAEAS